MNNELDLATFSTFVFTILILACFKPLRGTYIAGDTEDNKTIQKQRLAEQRAFSQEMEYITNDFHNKYADALRGQLKKEG